MARAMCHHHELVDWEAIREEIEEREADDGEAESEHEAIAPTADD